MSARTLKLVVSEEEEAVLRQLRVELLNEAESHGGNAASALRRLGHTATVQRQVAKLRVLEMQAKARADLLRRLLND